ncbi:MAG: efflux RND transporter periplasmic adaptor subunit [Thermomicrobiales bacterium]
MSRSRVALGIVAACAVIALVVWYMNGRGEERATAIVERGSIDVTIQTVGTLQATGATTIRATEGGAIDRLGVKAGDVVIEGDIVALLDLEPFDRGVRNAERGQEQAEFALQAAEQLADEETADNSLRVEVLNASEQVERAETALDDALISRRNATIVSPASGTVIELLVREGDLIGGNQPVARVATPIDFVVIADVDELDLPNVAAGAEARFRLDAFPATELTGRVVSTAPQARQQGGATVFATEIVFTPPDGLDLRPGMNADITIVTAARADVLLIPEAALRTVGDRSYVLVNTDDGSEEREIVLGYRGSGQVEVVSGLAEGESVVLR